MTRTFTYTFKHIIGGTEQNIITEDITLTKKVTDRMEERNAHKAGYAANYFNQILRSQYGYHHSPVTASRIQEV